MFKRFLSLLCALLLALSMSSFAAAEDEVITIFVDESWWPYDTWEGAIPEAFNAAVGAKIEVIRAADGNQLALMVASGDMTDMVCSYRYQYMADPEVSYALDELAEKYPQYGFNPHPVLEFVNTMADGHYYTIGCGFSPNAAYDEYDTILTEGQGFFYRTDIAEALGLTITSLEELDAAFAKVKEAYPEMTVLNFNYIHKFGWLRDQMGVPGGGFYDQDGKLVWYIQSANQLDYYKKVNEWYRLGYISPDNFAYSSEDQTLEAALAGNTFAIFGYDNHCDNYNVAAAAAGANFTFTQVTQVIGENATKFNNGVGGRGLYITKSCKNVEKAFEILSYAYGDEGMKLLMWGIEGEDYTLNEGGYPVFNYNFQGDNSVLQPRGLKYWGWLVHNNIVTSIADATSDSDTAKARAAATPIVKLNPAIGLIRFETDSDEAVIQSKLGDMISAEEVNILMAETEEACVAAYEAMLAKAEQIGVQQLCDSANERYVELKAAYDEVADLPME